MFEPFRRALLKLRIQLGHINEAELVYAWQQWRGAFNDWLVVLFTTKKSFFEILKTTFFHVDMFYVLYVIHGNGNARINAYVNGPKFSPRDYKRLRDDHHRCTHLNRDSSALLN